MTIAKKIRISVFLFVFLSFILVTGTGCATALKTRFKHKKQESQCTISQLVGPDKYYYSDRYQNKLKRRTKRIGRK